jgi:hypothetical protein
MERKSVQLGIIALALLLAFSAAWLLFLQGGEYQTSRRGGQEKEQARGSSAPANASERVDEVGASAGGNATAQAEESGNRTDSGDRGEAARDSRKVVTPAFVLDLAEFVVSRYHPEWGLDNPREKGILRLSFRSLNVRYGTELIGLRHSSSALKEARQEILARLLDPDILKHAYIRFADSFVRALVREGEKSTRRVKTPAGEVRERSLSDADVAEMLQLGSSYLRDVSAVLDRLGKTPELDALITDYLEAQNRAVHFNYKLNQAEEELADRKSRSEDVELEQLREKRRSIVKDYSRAIAKREQARQKLVDRVTRGTEEKIDLGVAEILYIAEWVHRRVPGEQKRSAIVTAGHLFRDLSDRLDRRTRELGSH